MMYSYYAARALGFRVPKKLAMIITVSQIVQMVVGCFVTYYGYAKASQGIACQIPEGTAKLGLIMYGSYFVLFAHFFVNAYYGSKRPRESSQSCSIAAATSDSVSKAKTQ